MQTFLPYPDFNQSARCLDYKRLGKQRSECKIILNGGWIHHPISKMWRPYRWALIQYTWEICSEWSRRGYNDNVHFYLIDLCLKEYIPTTFNLYNHPNYIKPLWLGDDRLHSSHRSNLLRKFPEHYGQFGWLEPNNLPYFYPSV